MSFRLGFQDKTVWDWLNLVLFPLFLFCMGWWLNNEQQQRQEEFQSNKFEQEASLQRARSSASTVDTFILAISNLIIDKELKPQAPNDMQSIIASALTESTLSRLDVNGQTRIIKFLADTALILAREEVDMEEEARPSISLKYSILKNVELTRVSLQGVDLKGSDLTGAGLSLTDLSGANFESASLRNANLLGANLKRANFSRADLRSTSLGGSDFTETNLDDALLGG